MNNEDFFNDDDGEDSQAVDMFGKLAMVGLHAVTITFLFYSGAHSVSAAIGYAGTSWYAKLAQIVGIATLETVMISLYAAYMTQRITGAAQTLVAFGTFVVGLILSCLGIVADSQLQSGGLASIWLDTYLHWLMPLSPAIMAVGALLVHSLSVEQIQARREAQGDAKFALMKFDARMNRQRAQLKIAKMDIQNQLDAQISSANQQAAWYKSEAAQQAITGHAMTNAPISLRSIGITAKAEPHAADELFDGGKSQVVRLEEGAPDNAPLVVDEVEADKGGNFQGEG